MPQTYWGNARIAEVMDRLFRGETIDQPFVDAYMEESMRLASGRTIEPEEAALLELEWKGGTCAVCGAAAVRIEETGPNLSFAWFQPTCGCYGKMIAERRRQDHLTRVYEDSDVPKSFWSVNFGNWDQSVDRSIKAAIEQAYEWIIHPLLNDSQGLLIHGGIGTGKTRLAVCVLVETAERGTRCMFLNSSTLSMLVFDRSELLARNLDRAGFVVLDDFDKARSDTEFARENLFSLVNKVISDGKRFVITTNVSPPEKLAARFDKAIMSRLIGSSAMIELKGRDYRLSRPKESRQ